MTNTMISVRLSSGLAAALGRAAESLDLSASQLVEMLLKKGEPYQKELLKAPLDGPFPKKINVRLSPEGMNKLWQLTAYQEVRPGEFVYRIRPSIYIRSLISYFLSTPEAFQAVFPDALGAEEWAQLSEDVEEEIPRQAHQPSPGDRRIGLLILLLPLLLVVIIGVIDLFKRPEGREPPPPPPSSGGNRRLAGDAEKRVDQSPEETL